MQVSEEIAAQSKDMNDLLAALYTNFAEHGAAAQKGWQHFIVQV